MQKMTTAQVREFNAKAHAQTEAVLKALSSEGTRIGLEANAAALGYALRACSQDLAEGTGLMDTDIARKIMLDWFLGAFNLQLKEDE